MPRKYDDGGPAFPCETPREIHVGASLRDYLAAKAMQGWLATYGEAEHPSRGDGAEKRLANLARESYAIADAMLAARKEPKDAPKT